MSLHFEATKMLEHCYKKGWMKLELRIVVKTLINVKSLQNKTYKGKLPKGLDLVKQKMKTFQMQCCKMHIILVSNRDIISLS